MLRILHGTNYDFIKPWRIAVGITAVFIAGGLTFLGIHGINRSIEFTGGTLMQVQFTQPPNEGDIRAVVDGTGYSGAEIQQFGTARDFTIRAAGRDPKANVEKVSHDIEVALHNKFGATEPKVVRTEIIGARVGDELSRDAMIAILISLFVTLLYLAFRFEWRFGVAAVLATAHD